MARACVLQLSLAVALVPPAARLSSHVVCGGAAYDYYIQSFGCTAEEAAKAERRLLPTIAESLTQTQIDCVCVWLQSSLDLSDVELKRVVTRHPPVLACSVEANMEPKLEWLQDRLELDEGQLRKIVLRSPQTLGLGTAARVRNVTRP